MELFCLEAQAAISSWYFLVRIFINMPPLPLLYSGVGRWMLYFHFQLDMKTQHEKLQTFHL